MLDIQKQIDYWVKGAEEDILTAQLLIREKRTLPGLFFCYLAIEKVIKAHVVNRIGDEAPQNQNLIELSIIAELEIDDATRIFLGILMKYQLQGRYPDYDLVIPEQPKVIVYFNETKDLLQKLKMKLQKS
jgi:HEPN domain-containing protein